MSPSHDFKQLFIVDWFIILLRWGLKTWGKKAGFGNFGETVSPSDFEIVARTHARVLYSCHFEKVGLSMTLENIVELGRPTFSKIFAQPLAWILYSFLTQIFLLWVVLEKEFIKHDMENIVRIVSRVYFVRLKYSLYSFHTLF